MYKLKNLLALFLVFSFIPLTLLAQFTLSIEINDLKNDNGQILLEFCNEQGEKQLGIIQPPLNNQCIMIIPDLKAGKYTFQYFHDENKNEKLDTNWLGIPKEGFGFSNNAEERFSAPSIEKRIFEIKGNMTQKCSPKYY
ncbi:MAG: DUF2141 domain-containing protein [Candidatus Neomarinimicrobiota bacterium]|jgi:uncharacterized protein (DUF2141 family)